MLFLVDIVGGSSVKKPDTGISHSRKVAIVDLELRDPGAYLPVVIRDFSAQVQYFVPWPGEQSTRELESDIFFQNIVPVQ